MFTLIIEDRFGGIADEYSFESGEFFIGRSQSSDIILPSDNVSRRHARLYTVDGKCYIEDLQSSNGVYVDGRRITEVFQIKRSAQIKVGDYFLHIESDAAPDEGDDRTWCKLIGQNGSFARQVYRIKRKVTLVGRGKDCTLTIIDPSVSRIHAKLTVSNAGKIKVEDLKSSNGSFVNGKRIETHDLRNGDLLRIGNIEFKVEIPNLETKITEGPSYEAPAAAAPVAAQPAKPPQTDAQPAPVPEPARLSESEYEALLRPSASDRRPQQGIASPLQTGIWSNEKKTPPWTLWLIVGVFVVTSVAVLLIVFRDDLFPDDTPEQRILKADPSAEQLAKAEAGPSDEIDAILDAANDYIRQRQWDKARERLHKALEIDPLDRKALQSLNRIQAMESDRERLEKGRRLRDELKRGEAASTLRVIDDTSVYYSEAQEELRNLLEAKDTLLLAANNSARERDCEGALKILQEIQLIDPDDEKVTERRAEIEGWKGSRRCQ